MSYSFDVIGFVHLGSAIFAMILGMLVILIRKGTKKHIFLGYLYVINMIILNITALMIFDLFSGFGPFHYMALFSLATILVGIIPAYRKKPEKNWLDYHYEFMNWSIIGLYAAFWSETFSRYFRFAGFWTLVIIATILTIVIGAFLLKSKKKRILKEYSLLNKK